MIALAPAALTPPVLQPERGETIMKGHNSAPFRPKILGTALTLSNLLTALIYRPGRSSHTSS